MILEIVLAVLVFVIVILLAYFFWYKSKETVTARKTISAEGSVVIIEAKRDILSAELIDRVNGKNVSFLRSNLKKGETVQFSYDQTTAKAVLKLRFDGEEKQIELEPGAK